MSPREQGYADAIRGLTIDTNCPVGPERAAYRAGWRDGDDAKTGTVETEAGVYTVQSYANTLDALARGRKNRRSKNRELEATFQQYKHLSLGN